MIRWVDRRRAYRLSRQLRDGAATERDLAIDALAVLAGCEEGTRRHAKTYGIILRAWSRAARLDKKAAELEQS